MNLYLLTACIIVLLLPKGRSLFSYTCTNSFTLSGFTYPAQNIAIEGTGSKFMVWNDQSQIQMYTTNGTKLCSGTFLYLQKVLWPADYNPIVLLRSGSAFVTLIESTCQVLQTFDIKTIINNTKDLGFWINFAQKSNRPTLVVSGFNGAYEIDLVTSALTNTYTTFNSSPSYVYDSFYRADQNFIFVSMTDRVTMQYFLKIWNTSQVLGKPIKSFDEKIKNTTVSTIDSTGNITKQITRQTRFQAVAVSDTNSFDSGLFFKPKRQRRIEVMKLDTAERLQNITQDNSLISTDYSGRTLLLLDSAQQISSYKYQNDAIPVPPKPDENSITLWVIIAVAAGGAVIIAVLVFFICKKIKANKNQGFDNKKYGKLNDEV